MVGDDRNKERTAYTLFKLGAGCTKAIGETLNLVDGFITKYYPRPESPFLKNNQMRGNLAYPATALKKVLEKIREEIDKRPELRNRQRVVVMIVDAETDEGGDTQEQKDKNPNSFVEAQKLRDIRELTLIVAGNDADYKQSLTELKRYYEFLRGIAGPGNGDNVVMSDSPKGLIKGIVKRMAHRSVGALCEDQGEYTESLT